MIGEQSCFYYERVLRMPFTFLFLVFCLPHWYTFVLLTLVKCVVGRTCWTTSWTTSVNAVVIICEGTDPDMNGDGSTTRFFTTRKTQQLGILHSNAIVSKCCSVQTKFICHCIQPSCANLMQNAKHIATALISVPFLLMSWWSISLLPLSLGHWETQICCVCF